MCRVLHVSRSCYYHWQRVEHQEDTNLNDLIKDAFMASRRTYGTRRIKKNLEVIHGLTLSRRRIGHIMKKLSLSTGTKRRFRVQTTDSSHSDTIAPNRLNRDFHTATVDTIYVGDITYILIQEEWIYLATVLDLYSRKIVGWSMDKTMTTTLVNDALLMALKARTPQEGLIWHTDRGTQYASDSHRKLLSQYGIVHSMSRKGNCWDNAVAESFFHSLKTELIYRRNFETTREAYQAIFEYIEVFYNRQRLHSSNDYLSPVDFENRMLLNCKSA